MIYSDRIISPLELLSAVDEMSWLPGPYVVSTWQVANAFKLSDSGFAPEVVKVGFTLPSNDLPKALQEVLEKEVFREVFDDPPPHSSNGYRNNRRCHTKWSCKSVRFI